MSKKPKIIDLGQNTSLAAVVKRHSAHSLIHLAEEDVYGNRDKSLCGISVDYFRTRESHPVLKWRELCLHQKKTDFFFDLTHNGCKKCLKLFNNARITKDTPIQKGLDMGTDIHAYVEEFRNGEWVYADTYTVYYEYPESKTGMYLFKYEIEKGKIKDSPNYVNITRFPTRRNYNLFAILADVRNGYYLHSPDQRKEKGNELFVPIDKPRGMPNYPCSHEVQKEYERYGSDGHSHSWLTMREILDYDWTQSIEESHYLSKAELENYKRTGKLNTYEETIYSLSEEMGTVSIYRNYAEAIGYDNWYKIMTLCKTEDPEDTRIVFWFDN